MPTMTVTEIADLAAANLYAAAEAAETLCPLEVLDALRAVEERPVTAQPAGYRAAPLWKRRGNQARAQALASALEDAAIRAHGLEPDIMRKPQDRAAWAKVVKTAARAADRGRVEALRGFVAGQHVGRVAALWLWLGPNREDRTATLAAALNAALSVPANDHGAPLPHSVSAAAAIPEASGALAETMRNTVANVSVGANDNIVLPDSLPKAA